MSREISGPVTIDLTNHGDQAIPVPWSDYIVTGIFVTNINGVGHAIPSVTVYDAPAAGGNVLTGGMSGGSVDSPAFIQQISPGPAMLDGVGPARVISSATLYARLSALGYAWPAGSTGDLYVEAIPFPS